MGHGGAFERLPVMFSSSDALDVLCLQTKSTEFFQCSVKFKCLTFRPGALSDCVPMYLNQFFFLVIRQRKSNINIFFPIIICFLQHLIF